MDNIPTAFEPMVTYSIGIWKEITTGMVYTEYLFMVVWESYFSWLISMANKPKYQLNSHTLQSPQN